MNLRSGSAVGQGVLLKASRAQFEEGVELIFSKWTALQLAVDQEWGGRGSKTKAEDMLDEVIDWFYRKKKRAGHDIHDLEPLLETIMLEDFNVQAEDGSPAQVGQGLLQWYEQCLAGDFSMLERLRQVQDGAQASRGQAVDNDGTAVAMDADGDSSSSSSSSGDEGGDAAEQHAGQGGGDDDGMDEDAPAQQQAAAASAGPVVDDDGFQLVQRGRRRR